MSLNIIITELVRSQVGLACRWTVAAVPPAACEPLSPEGGQLEVRQFSYKDNKNNNTRLINVALISLPLL